MDVAPSPKDYTRWKSRRKWGLPPWLARIAAKASPDLSGLGPGLFTIVQETYPSGKGMNSASPLTIANRPAFQSALASSMRSLREDTKFHQM